MEDKYRIRIMFALAAAVTASGLAAGLPFAGQAHAAGIQRCILPDGGMLYTDATCARHGATPAPMTDRLVARLADAQQAEMDAGGKYVDASLTVQVPSNLQYARRPAAAGCARTPTQLVMDLQASFALGEVNRVAESFHWVGMDQASATHVMQRLERLGRSQLVDARFHDATILSTGAGNWVDAGAAASPGVGIMQLDFGRASLGEQVELDVERYSGCYFVSF